MTHEEVVAEVREVEKDLQAFKVARGALYRRISELDNSPERKSMLTDWPVMKVVDNGLIVAIVRCEGLLEDYRNLLDQTAVPDNVVQLERDDERTGD